MSVHLSVLPWFLSGFVYILFQPDVCELREHISVYSHCPIYCLLTCMVEMRHYAVLLFTVIVNIESQCCCNLN